MKKATRKRVVWICMVALIGLLSASIARADFYVVAAGKKAKKTILVSPKGTETASGTALLDAMNGITDAGVTNPYLIFIEAGIYDIGTNFLQMKEYVDIQGAGEAVTKITGTNVTAGSGVLMGADNAEVRFITVESTGADDYAIAIYNSSVSPAITHVTAIASGGPITNIGVFNTSSSPSMTNVTASASGAGESLNSGVRNYSSSPTMTNVTASSSGGGSSSGVYNHDSSSPMMMNVTAAGSGGTDNLGVRNVTSSPTMINVTATASGGTDDNYGVRNSTSSSPTMINVTVTASGGPGDNYGVYNQTSSYATIDHSVLSGDDAAVYITGSGGVTTCIGNTLLNGGVSGSDPTKCAGVYDEDFVFYADTCP